MNSFAIAVAVEWQKKKSVRKDLKAAERLQLAIELTGVTAPPLPPLPLLPNACAANTGDGCVTDFLLPLLLPELELLLSSAPDNAPFCCCSALTISCFASDVFVPGLVRLIFILSPLSNVA